MTHIVVDPVTRIEGHLRIEAEVDGGRVTDAWSSATMFRGIKLILKGRHPRDAWAFTQRICGVCTTVHAIASIRAVENAIGAQPPQNARLLGTSGLPPAARGQPHGGGLLPRSAGLAARRHPRARHSGGQEPAPAG